MRVVRALGWIILGAWGGFNAAAALARRAVPRRGDEESDELALVAIYDGIELKSRAQAFRGGSLFAWFGGISVDLRRATLAPGAQLTLHTLFGGIAIWMPTGWRVESKLRAVAGGVDVRAPEPEDPAAPMLTLDGRAIFGGISVGAKAVTPD